jgi:hypothetical protein
VIAPLAVQLVRPELPRQGAYVLTVRFPGGRGAASAALTYELENETPGQPAASRRITGRWSDGRRTVDFVVPRALRVDPRLSTMRLVLSNGGERRAAYVVSAR